MQNKLLQPRAHNKNVLQAKEWKLDIIKMESISEGATVVKILYNGHAQHIQFIIKNSLQPRHKT